MTVIHRERTSPATEAWAAPPPDVAPASIAELLSCAKTEIAAGEKSMRRAAEYIAAAQAKGAKQTAIAKELGKSQSWVNRLLRWHGEGCIGDAFGRSHHRERVNYYPGNNSELSEDDQARVKAAQAAAWKKDRKFLLEMFFKEMNRAGEAQERVKQLEAEKFKRLMADLQSETQRPAAKAEPAVKAKPIDHEFRDRLVKLLGMLGSSGDGEVVNAARMAEDLRLKLKLTWPDLIVAAAG